VGALDGILEIVTVGSLVGEMVGETVGLRVDENVGS